jgi:hypothetical protein
VRTIYPDLRGERLQLHGVAVRIVDYSQGRYPMVELPDGTCKRVDRDLLAAAPAPRWDRTVLDSIRTAEDHGHVPWDQRLDRQACEADR